LVDASTALYALVGSVVTALIGGVVTIAATVLNSRTERARSAANARDDARQAELDVKDERITLRDEQLAACEADRARLAAALERERARA